jgi:hypothetical protein
MRRRILRVPVEPPSAATFSSSRVTLVDISIHGAAIVHLHPFRLYRRAPLEIALSRFTLSVPSEVRGCRLIGRRSDGTALYRSGLRFDLSDPSTSGTINELVSELVTRMIHDGST